MKSLSKIFCLMSVTVAVLLAQALPSHAAVTSFYNTLSSWTAAVASLGDVTGTQTFLGTTLNPGVSVVSSAGSIISPNWSDNVSHGGANTKWTFGPGLSVPPLLNAWGGVFDTAYQGSGQGLQLTIGLGLNGTPTVLLTQQVPDNSASPGVFFGFVTNQLFTSVTVEGGTQGGLAESYLMNSMVYAAAVPEPSTWLGFAAVVAGMLMIARSQARKSLLALSESSE